MICPCAAFGGTLEFPAGTNATRSAANHRAIAFVGVPEVGMLAAAELGVGSRAGNRPAATEPAHVVSPTQQLARDVGRVVPRRPPEAVRVDDQGDAELRAHGCGR